MTISDYSKTPRSDGYRGLRVSGKLDGQQIQRYFKPERIAQARKLEKEIVSQRPKKRYQRGKYCYRASRYDAQRRTEIVGLTIDFSVQRNCNPVKYYPTIKISHTDKSRDLNVHTTRTIGPKRNLIDSWRESCKLMADLREFKRVPRGWYELCPSRKMFVALRKFYNDRGAGISWDAIDRLGD